MYIEQWQSVASSEVITKALHGGNFVATANDNALGSTFSSVKSSLNIDGIRFPGGDVVERYLEPGSEFWEDWFNSPNSTIALDSERDFSTVQNFFELAFQEDRAVNFVLPTLSLLDRTGETIEVDLDALGEVHDKVFEILTGRFGPVEISQFEIGNEYYLDGRMSASEYGLVANELVKVVSSAISEAQESGLLLYGTEPPEIIVQAGAPWQHGDNATIIDQLDIDAREVIDGISIHWYPRDLGSIERLNGHFGLLDEWEAAPGFDTLGVHVTEWNVFNSDAGDKGMLQASTLIEAYERLSLEGITSANIWGVEFDNLRTRLGYSAQEGSGEEAGFRLTPAGEAIRLLFSTSEGLNRLDINAASLFTISDGSDHSPDDYTISAFGNADRLQLYISWRSEANARLDFNLDDFLGGAHYANIQVIQSVDNPSTPFDESDPLSPRAAPHIQSAGWSLGEEAGLQLNVSGYEIIRLELLYGHEGVFFEGQSGTEITGLNYIDDLTGSRNDDTLLGQLGDDSLRGDGGRDLIFGGKDDDQLIGGEGSDALFGGEDDDSLGGGDDADIIVGGNGSDTLDGGDGQDILFGSEGSNLLQGGTGDDLLISTGNSDTLVGGDGGDVFSISTTEDTTVEDWRSNENDFISFQGSYETVDEVLARSFIVELGDGLPSDLIVAHEGGFQTVFKGAGSQLDHFGSSLLDHSPTGEYTMHQVAVLSDLSEEQITQMVGALSSEELDGYTLGLDPGLLISNLDVGRAASFLNGLTHDEAREFLSDLSDDNRTDILLDLTRAEINDFFQALEADPLAAMIEGLEDSKLQQISAMLDDPTRTIAEHKLERFYFGVQTDADDEEGALKTAVEHLLRVFAAADPSDEDDNRPDEEDDDRSEQVTIPASCFIATVVYRDHEHPNVWLLRWFRDHVLRKTVAGRLFIKTYWLLGPVVAEFISGRATPERFARFIINCLVWLISFATGRNPGRQADHIDFGDTRQIKVRGRPSKKFPIAKNARAR